MPQLDFSTYPSQIFWSLAIFALMFLLIWQWFVPKISNVITARSSKLSTDLLQAEQLRNNAKNLANKIEKKLNETKKLAQHKVIDSQKTYNVQINNLIAKQENEIMEQIKFAKNKADDIVLSNKNNLEQLSLNIVKNILDNIGVIRYDENIIHRNIEKQKIEK